MHLPRTKATQREEGFLEAGHESKSAGAVEEDGGDAVNMNFGGNL